MENSPACAKGSYDFFAPEKFEWLAEKYCKHCPVKEGCLEEAMAEEKLSRHNFRYGLRGGLTPRERARLAQRRKSLQKKAQEQA